MRTKIFDENGVVLYLDISQEVPIFMVTHCIMGEVNWEIAEPANKLEIRRARKANSQIPAPIYPTPDFASRDEFNLWFSEIVKTIRFRELPRGWVFWDSKAGKLISSLEKVVGLSISHIYITDKVQSWQNFKDQYPEKLSLLPAGLVEWVNAGDTVASVYYAEARKKYNETLISVNTE